MTSTEDLTWAIKNGDNQALENYLGSTDIHIDKLVVANGTPAIICAADYGQTEIIELLLKKGADVNKQSSAGISALLVAIWEGHYNAVEILLKNGANKKLQSPRGKSYEEEATNEKIKELLKKY